MNTKNSERLRTPSELKALREQILRVECLVSECLYPERESCLKITPHSVYRCPHCRWHEIPEENWVCDGCGSEFDRLEKYFEIPSTPVIEEIQEAPEITPNVHAVPLISRIKVLCKKCLENLGEDS